MYGNYRHRSPHRLGEASATAELLIGELARRYGRPAAEAHATQHLIDIIDVLHDLHPMHDIEHSGYPAMLGT